MYRLARLHDEAQVGLEQVILRPAAVLGDPLEVDPLIRGHPLDLGQLLLGEQAGLDPLGQLDLLLGVEQRYLADLLEVVLDRVRRRAGHRHLGGGQVVVVIAEDQVLVLRVVPGGLALGLACALAGYGRRGGIGVLGQVRFGVLGQIGFRQLCVGYLDLDLDDLQIDLHDERVVVEVLEVLEIDRAVQVLPVEAGVAAETASAR